MQALRSAVAKTAETLNRASTRVAVAGLSLVPVLAHADPSDPGLDAINALTTKATAYITATFAVAVLVAAGFWGISFMKKSFGKAK